MDKEFLLEYQMEPSSSKKILVTSYDGFKEVQPSNSLSKYNLFVRCYNKACNRVDQKTLIFVSQSKLYSTIEFMLSKLHFLILLIIGLLTPFTGIFLFFYITVGVYYYFKALKVYQKNQIRVKDPFEKMKFDHIKCSQLKKNFHFITLNFKTLKSEFNFKQNGYLAQSQRKSGKVSEWMIYNEIFASYHTDLPKWKPRLIFLLIMALIMSLKSTILFLILF